MVSFLSNIPQLAFSESFADLLISADDALVRVYIAVGTDVLFDEELVPYNGKLTVYDVKSLLSVYMLNNDLHTCSVKFVAAGSNSVTKLSTVLLTTALPDMAIQQVDSHFLTTRQFITLPRDQKAFDLLHFYNTNGNGSGASVRFRIESNGEVFNSSFSRPAMPNNSSLMIKYSDFNYILGDGDKIVSASAIVGNRSIPIFFSDFMPTVSFIFLNAFGRQEVIHIFGTTEDKLNVEREVANCYNRSMFYDSSKLSEFSVVSLPMTPFEAEQLQQLFASPRVAVLQSPDDWEDTQWSNYEEVLITSSEVVKTDSDEELTTAKFTWRFASNQAKVKLY